jgi:hypothetical protein
VDHNHPRGVSTAVSRLREAWGGDLDGKERTCSKQHTQIASTSHPSLRSSMPWPGLTRMRLRLGRAHCRAGDVEGPQVRPAKRCPRNTTPPHHSDQGGPT